MSPFFFLKFEKKSNVYYICQNKLLFFFFTIHSNTFTHTGWDSLLVWYPQQNLANLLSQALKWVLVSWSVYEPVNKEAKNTRRTLENLSMTWKFKFPIVSLTECQAVGNGVEIKCRTGTPGNKHNKYVSAQNRWSRGDNLKQPWS